MNRLAIPVAALAICALHTSALGQGSMTTPLGGLAQEGNHHAHAFGWYPDARYQLFDDEHTGGKGATITQIAFRLDNRSHTSSTATGRTWTKITLDISETSNYANVGLTWAQNITATPTQVFNNKWSWPTQTGVPALKPDLWGGVKGQLRFPFTKPWRYSGKQAMLMDYVFRGGSLASNAAWTIATSADFFLDSASYETVLRGKTAQIPSGATMCADSAFPSVLYPGAGIYADALFHGPTSTTVSLRNKLWVEHHSYFTALNAPVIHALGLGGLGGGVNIGARCNALYVDFNKPVALVHLKTQGQHAYSAVTWTTPLHKALVSQEIYLQAAWADSKTQGLGLSMATKLTLPASLPATVIPRYKTILSFLPDLPVAYSVFNVTHEVFPFTQYKTQ